MYKYTKKPRSGAPELSVRTVRLELTQANAHYPLKVACLPFHHVRKSREVDVFLIRDCKYTQ